MSDSESKSGTETVVHDIVQRPWLDPERTRVLQAAGLALEAIAALQDDKDGSLISPARLALRKCVDRTVDDVFASAKDLRANKLNRGRLETLERRHDHLFDRVEADPSLKFDAAECAALHWAIRVLRQVVR